eukprot:COSAG01_NODE_36928_length_510_cov_9.875912_1_plen_34_part_10
MPLYLCRPIAFTTALGRRDGGRAGAQRRRRDGGA